MGEISQQPSVTPSRREQTPSSSSASSRPADDTARTSRQDSGPAHAHHRAEHDVQSGLSFPSACFSAVCSIASGKQVEALSLFDKALHDLTESVEEMTRSLSESFQSIQSYLQDHSETLDSLSETISSNLKVVSAETSGLDPDEIELFEAAGEAHRAVQRRIQFYREHPSRSGSEMISRAEATVHDYEQLKVAFEDLQQIPEEKLSAEQREVLEALKSYIEHGEHLLDKFELERDPLTRLRDILNDPSIPLETRQGLLERFESGMSVLAEETVGGFCDYEHCRERLEAGEDWHTVYESYKDSLAARGSRMEAVLDDFVADAPHLLGEYYERVREPIARLYRQTLEERTRLRMSRQQFLEEYREELQKNEQREEELRELEVSLNECREIAEKRADALLSLLEDSLYRLETEPNAQPGEQSKHDFSAIFESLTHFNRLFDIAILNISPFTATAIEEERLEDLAKRHRALAEKGHAVMPYGMNPELGLSDSIREQSPDVLVADKGEGRAVRISRLERLLDKGEIV